MNSHATIRFDTSRSIRSLVDELTQAALNRDQIFPESATADATLRRLVEAALRVTESNTNAFHEGLSTINPLYVNQRECLLIGDTSIHITAAPDETTIPKCAADPGKGLHPLIISTRDGAHYATQLVETAGLASKVDILEASQFIASSLLKRCLLRSVSLSSSVRDLVAAYNQSFEMQDMSHPLRIALV